MEIKLYIKDTQDLLDVAKVLVANDYAVRMEKEKKGTGTSRYDRVLIAEKEDAK